MEETQREYWRGFNLAERNPAQGGGILYCLRYSEEQLKEKQERVITAVQNVNMRIREVEGSSFEVDLKLVPTEDRRRAGALLEELSVINEALEYKGNGYNFRSIQELSDGLMGAYINRLTESGALAEAYNLVDVVIPQILRDLKITQEQGKKFSSREREKLRELEEFAKAKVNQLNSPGGVVVFGVI